MRKDTAQKLLPWINSKRFEEYVEIYTQERLDMLRRALEQSSDPSEIFRLQGQIKEIRRFQTLPDEVRTDIKKD